MSTFQKKHLPNLNAYRFLAALLVVLHHIEQIRYNAHLFNLKEYSLFNNGFFGVQFFFVLSGFLITYLLLFEIRDTNNVSLTSFYLKRVLRIWPLYYILVVIGFVILPLAVANQASLANKFPYLNEKGLFLYLFIFPNVANAIWSKHFLISLWSIGVEEQFYLFWAPLMKWFSSKLVLICFTIIGLRLLYSTYLYPHFLTSEMIHSTIVNLRFDCMAVGALVAFWLYKGISIKWQQLIYSRQFEIFMVLFLCMVLLMRKYLSENSFFLFLFEFEFGTQLISLLFGLLILNGASNPTTIFRIKGEWINYLGKISYGIYMYHMIFVFLVIELIKKIPILTSLSTISTLLVYGLVLFLTILVSAISYKYVELPIINLREKFIK